MSPRAWAAFAAVSVLWGIPYLFIKLAVDDGVPPGFVAWARVSLAAVLLLPLAWRTGALRGLRARRRAVLAYAAFEITIPFVLIPVGEQYISSSLTAILIASMPLIVALLALRLAPAERPRGTAMAGLFIGLAGVVALLGLDVAGKPRDLLGAACVLGATFCYALSTFIVRRSLAHHDPLGPVAAALGVAAVALTPLAIAAPPSQAPSALALGSMIVLGVACTALALLLFFFLIARAGPSRASIITYVNPTVAVALGVTLLGEHLGAVSVAGLLLVLAGSWLSTGGRLPPGLIALATRLRRGRRPGPTDRTRRALVAPA